ncbi:MAG: hypothetical protein H5T78_12015 [Nocardia sp.]|nr:hypothetical protein [Nocardia sp.]
MRFQESGPGSDGSPHSYTWVRHSLEEHGRSRLLITTGSLAAAITVAGIGYLLDIEDLLGIGLMLAVIAAIALSYSLSVIASARPVVTATARRGALSLRYRSVFTLPTCLTFMVFSPPAIVIGYQNMLPQAILGGVVGVVIALVIPPIAFFQRKRAFLHLSYDSIRLTTIFDDFELAWEHMLRIRATDHRPGIDTIMIEYEGNALIVRKKTRGFTSNHRGHEWEFLAKVWGSSLNSLLSTLTFLHENPDIRRTLNSTQLTAMLEQPAWAIQPTT